MSMPLLLRDYQTHAKLKTLSKKCRLLRSKITNLRDTLACVHMFLVFTKVYVKKYMHEYVYEVILH
jgi:hypothetical protein